MYKVAFLLKEFSDPSFAVQIYQTHRMGEFFHQPTQQTIEMLGRTAADSHIQTRLRPMPSNCVRAKYKHVSASLLLAYLYRPSYISAVLIGNCCRRHWHIRQPPSRFLYLPHSSSGTSE